MKKVGTLALGSSLLILSILPAASALAATGNAYITSVNLTESGNTYTASATTKGHPLVDYQFVVTPPTGHGHAYIAERFARSNHFTFKAPGAGYKVQANALTLYQVSNKTWGQARGSNVVTAGSATVSAPKLTVSGDTWTASAKASDGSPVYYQFIVKPPAGKGNSYIAQRFTSASTFKYAAPGAGYSVEANALTQSEVQAKDWGAAVGSGWTAAPSGKLSIGVSKDNLGVGSAQTLTLESNGTDLTSSDGTAKWTISKDGNSTSGATVDALASNPNKAIFNSTGSGTYTVTATLNGETATQTMTVYGTAAGVEIKPSSSSLVADGKATDTITATVVDSNHNTVSNYNGTATVVVPTGAVVLTTGSSQDSDISGTTLTFANGKATFLVTAATVPGLSSELTTSGLTAGSGSTQSSTVTYDSAGITSTPQVATSIAVSASPSTLEVNDNSGSATVSVQVNDQDGHAMLGGTYVLSGTIEGGGTFASGSSVTSQTIVASGDPATTSAHVYGLMGDTGTYVVSVSGSGLATGYSDISASVAGNAATLSASDSTTSFAQGSTTGTTVNLGAKDKNGVSVHLPPSVSPVVSITTSSGAAVTGLTVTASGASASTSASNGEYKLGSGVSGFTISDSGTSSADAGTYTVSIKDGEPSNALVGTSLTVTETPGTAGKLSLTPGTNVLTPGKLGTTLALQVTDAAGNAVDDANVPITVTASGVVGGASINGGSYSTNPSATVYTNADGQISVPFVAQDYTSTWTVTGTVASGTLTGATSSGTVYVESHPVASYSFNLTDAASGGIYAGNTTYAAAGDQVALTSPLASDALDANGNKVISGTAGNDNVTVTIDHASGLSGVPTSSGVTESSNATDNTLTLTGTLTDVSGVLSSSSLTAAKAGQLTIQVKDDSTGATGASSIDVVAGTQATELTLTGLSNDETLTTGTKYDVTVSLGDQGGNPVVASTSTTVDLASQSGLTYENASGVPVTTVTIGAGQSSASFMVVTSETGSLTSGSVAASATVGSGTVSGNVTGLND